MRIVCMCALLLLLLLGCNKSEPTSWRSQYHVPLATASLSISDFVDDSLLNESNGQLVLHLEQTLFDLNFDSIFSIPPDTAERTFSIPISSLQVPPGVSLFSDDEEYNFSQLDIQLRRAGIRSGTLRVLAENSAEGAMLFTYRVPKATRAGTALEVSVLVPGRSNGVPGEASLQINLADYDIDLRGPSGNGFNTLSTEFRLTAPADGDGILLTSNDQVLLRAEYSEISLAYAEGYFGSQQADFEGEGIAIDIPTGLSESTLHLPEARATLELENSLGADFRASIEELRAFNSPRNESRALQGPLIGQAINLERATRQGSNGISPSRRIIALNEDNSNLPALFSLIPDSIAITGLVVLNPLGNVSNFNDFMTEAGRLSAKIALDVPLNFSLDGLTLRDTVGLDAGNGTRPESGLLYVHAMNGFPLEATLSLYTLADDGSQIQLNDFLESDGQAPTGTAHIAGMGAISRLRYRIPEGMLASILEQPRLVIEVSMRSSDYPDLVQISGKERIEIFISSESEWHVEVR